MTRNLCEVDGCPNKGKYARNCGHLADEKTDMEKSDKDYAKVRAAFLKEHKNCQFGTCQKLATDIHHKKGRGKKYKCDPKTFLAVCRGHHLFLESHPVFAKQNGYSLSRLAK